MRRVIVYRDRILARSEHGFMRRQYLGFTRLDPVWVGCRRDPDLAGSGVDPIILGDDGRLGPLRRALFKQTGLVPDRARLAALEPALIHAQFGRGGAIALPLARALGVPLVVTFHGGDAHKDVHYRPASLFARRLPALLAYASRFVCVSPGVRDKLLARGFPADKLLVLPIGVEPAPAPVPPPEAGHILFIGRMVEKKGVPVLLDALARLRAAGDATPAVLVGDGTLLPALRARAEALGGVTLPGWQTQEQLRAWFAGALCLAVPSVTATGGDAEGLPSVAVEAMTWGVPLVASDQAGLSEILTPDGPGTLVPARNPDALAAALSALIADPARRARQAAAARALALRDFDATLQSVRLEDLLLSVLP